MDVWIVTRYVPASGDEADGFEEATIMGVFSSEKVAKKEAVNIRVDDDADPDDRHELSWCERYYLVEKFKVYDA